MALRPLARNVSNLKRLLEPEVQPRFRGNSHLLAVGPDLRARSCAAAYRGSNRRAFAASCNGSIMSFDITDDVHDLRHVRLSACLAKFRLSALHC